MDFDDAYSASPGTVEVTDGHLLYLSFLSVNGGYFEVIHKLLCTQNGVSFDIIMILRSISSVYVAKSIFPKKRIRISDPLQ